MPLMIYGASGYTGKLIAEKAAALGLKPVLAGRNETKIKSLADHLGLDFKIFDLEDEKTLDAALSEITVVLHCAGPFKFTARPMMQACLRTQTHYLDITGEIEIFEYAHYLDTAAKKAGIMLMPGVGFDVVPTDCLGQYLKKQLPDATFLELGFAGTGKAGWSKGTASTAVVNLGKGSAERRNGKIEIVPLGHKTLWKAFRGKKMFFMSIPWGDVSTAFHSTGIPDIITYSGINPNQYKWIRLQKYFNWLLGMPFVKKMALSRLQKGPAGPTDEERSTSGTFVWGAAKNESGEMKKASLITPNGYTLTVLSSLLITQKVLKGNLKPGFQTPSLAYGEDLVLEVEGVIREDEN